MSILRTRLLELAEPQLEYDSIALTPAAYSAKLALARELNKEVTNKEGGIDATDEEPSRIRNWLRELPLAGQVSVLWIGIGEGIKCDYEHFVANYDDLWLPASDDIWIMNSEDNVLLELNHEEQFSWMKCERRSRVN